MITETIGVYRNTDTEVQRETRKFQQFMTTVLQSNPDIAERMAEFQDLNQPVAASAQSRSRNTFEDALFRTRLYERLKSGLSARSSTSAWSQLSSRSLAEVPDISKIQLPVSHTQLSNGHLYERPTGEGIRYPSLAPNEAKEQGWTALHHSASKGQKENAQLLLNHGADIEAKTNNGATALYLAAQDGHRETVQLDRKSVV